jgi:hypothetical protein
MATASEITTTLIHAIKLMHDGSYTEAQAVLASIPAITELIGIDPDLAQAITSLQATMKGRMLFGPESTMNAAATTPLITAQSNLIQITGATTTITSFGDTPDTSLGAPPVRFLRFLNPQTVNAVVGGALNFGSGDTAVVQGLPDGTWILLLRGNYGAGGLLPVGLGGTGADNAAAARTNLGAQAASATLTSLAGLAGVAGRVPYFSGGTTLAIADSTAYGRGLWNLADLAAHRTALGISAVATTLLAQTTQALMRTTGLGLTTYGSSLGMAADAAAAKVLLAIAAADVSGFSAAADARITAQKGMALGLVPLAADSKIDTLYLPDSILGAVKYQGTWNAATNSPAIPAASAANKGWYYKVATAGTTTISGINDWGVGDWIISNGVSWDKIDNTDSVTSVAGLNGAITSSSLKTSLAIAPSDLTGLGANVATFLATPSSANLLAAMTDETGTGKLVFATSPTLITPTLGVATATGLTVNGPSVTSFISANTAVEIRLSNSADTGGYITYSATNFQIWTASVVRGVFSATGLTIAGGLTASTTIAATGAMSAASLALGGAAIGANALAVTGAAQISGNLGVGIVANAYAGYGVVTVGGTTGGELDFMAGGALVGSLFGNAGEVTVAGKAASPVKIRQDAAYVAQSASDGFGSVAGAKLYVDAGTNLNYFKTAGSGFDVMANNALRIRFSGASFINMIGNSNANAVSIGGNAALNAGTFAVLWGSDTNGTAANLSTDYYGGGDVSLQISTYGNRANPNLIILPTGSTTVRALATLRGVDTLVAATAKTMFALPVGGSTYIVSVIGAPAGYQGSAIITIGGNNDPVLAQLSTAGITLSMSGLNVQATSALGQAVTWAAIRIA